MIPTLQDIRPPARTCNMCDASIHVSNLSWSSDPIILRSSFVAFRSFRILLSFPQSSLVGHWTLVHKKDTDVSNYGHDFFMVQKILAVIEW